MEDAAAPVTSAEMVWVAASKPFARDEKVAMPVERAALHRVADRPPSAAATPRAPADGRLRNGWCYRCFKVVNISRSPRRRRQCVEEAGTVVSTRNQIAVVGAGQDEPGAHPDIAGGIFLVVHSAHAEDLAVL